MYLETLKETKIRQQEFEKNKTMMDIQLSEQF